MYFIGWLLQWAPGSEEPYRRHLRIILPWGRKLGHLFIHWVCYPISWRLCLGVSVLFLFWAMATCRLSCLPCFLEKMSGAENLEIRWQDLELESGVISKGAHHSYAEIRWAKGSLAKTTATICCRPPSSPLRFLIMCRGSLMSDCTEVAGAREAMSDVNALGLFQALQSSSPLWQPLDWYGSSVWCPHLCHLPLRHITATLCQHQTTEVGRILFAWLCILYSDFDPQSIKAMRIWETSVKFKYHLEEEHLDPPWPLPALSWIS